MSLVSATVQVSKCKQEKSEGKMRDQDYTEEERERELTEQQSSLSAIILCRFIRSVDWYSGRHNKKEKGTNP